MTMDLHPSMAQSVRTGRSSFSSSNGNGDTPLHSAAALSNGDDYDSDSSSLAPATPRTLSMDIPAELAGAIPLIDRFQVEGFLRLMQKQIQSAGKRGFFTKKSVGPQPREKFTFEDMLCFQKDPIPTSLLKINSDLVNRATKLFQIILKYMGVDSSDRVTPASLDERVELVGKMYKQALKRTELRDELFAQISKQTRNNPDKEYLIKAWELMFLCASSMPPSKDIGGYLSEYVHNVAHGVNIDSEVRVLALNTLNALKRSVKAGPRHTIPGREEIEALLTGRKLTTIVFFLDETFEEITYDMATTVADAVEELAGVIKLSAFSSFSLFECRKVVTGSKSPDPGNEEYIGLDDNKYIGDLLAEFKAAKDRSKGEILHCKLTFKKKLFRESDEAVADPMFVQLSYVQLQHDYMLGNYPVGRDDAAQLSALQILVDIGFACNPESCTDWNSLLERFLPRQIAITRAKREWEFDILSRYHSMENLTKDDARQQFLRILRTLPYGNSVFFSVRKIDDPIGLLPGRIILGINKRGVHFFRPVPKEYLHSAELRDIMQFGSSNTAVFFKMRVAGVLHIFQFETKQGEEICVALQTHINDVMLRRYSKARSATSGSTNGDLSNNFKPSDVEMYEKCVQDLSKAVEESQRNADQLQEELREKQKQEAKLQEDLESLKQSLAFEKQNLTEFTSEHGRLRSSCDEKDKALQAALLEKKGLEGRLAKLSNLVAEKNNKTQLGGGKNQNLEDEIKLRSEELQAKDEIIRRLTDEKLLLEQRISGIEKTKADEIDFLEKKNEQEHKALKLRVLELEKKLSISPFPMASNVPEDPPCNSETEAETIALRIKQKRSRRVSFADTEITSVHIFNRDEDYDTPPDPKPQASSQNDAAGPENEVIGFFRDLGGDSDDFKYSDDDDEDDDGRKSFFRPIGSPSPGSSVPGSATSNDEDNFFGPVSANFIRPGRLSDSAASDDIHEATLDTTAFSMHYRSLARSDSGGDLKTPTAVRLAFEEKTPTHNTNPTDSGSLMSLTKPKMLSPQSLASVDKVRSGEDSNDMSIIEENPHKYDYGRLSPTLDAILAEGSKDLHADSVSALANSVPSKGVEVSALEENGIGHMDPRNGRLTELGNFGTHDMPAEADSVSRIKLNMGNDGDISSKRSHYPSVGDSVDGQVQIPNQLSKVNKESSEDAFPKGREKLELAAVNGNALRNTNSKAHHFDVFAQHEPAYQHSSQPLVQEHSSKENIYKFNSDHHSEQQYGSPIEGSMFLLSGGRQQSVLSTPIFSRHSGIVTPSSKQPGSLLNKEHTKHDDWVSSIQKNISRFTIPKPSPCASSLKEGIEKLKSRLLSYSSVISPLKKTVLTDVSKDLECKFSNSPTTCLEKELAIPDLNSGHKILFNTDSNGNENPVDTSKLGQGEDTTDLAKESLHNMLTDTPSKDKFGKPRKAVDSHSQLSSSGSERIHHLLMSENPTDGTLVSSETNSLLADEREDNVPLLQIESEKKFQSPSRGAVILKSPDTNFQAGPEQPHFKPYVCRSTSQPSLQSPSSKESAQNSSMKRTTQSPPQENPTPSPSWRKAIQSPSRKEPSQSLCRQEPTQSPSRKELTQSPRREPIRSPFMKEPIQSPISREAIRSSIAREPIGSPAMKEPSQSPSRKEPSQSPSRKEPIRSPLRKETTWSPSRKEPTWSPSRKEPTQSPFRLVSSYAVDTENMQRFVGKDLVSHESNSNEHDDCHRGLHMLQSPFSEQDAENSVGRKRKNLGIILDDGDSVYKTPRIQSLKVHRNKNYDPEFMLGQSNIDYNDREKFGADTTWKCWTDILVKFSRDTEQLLSPLTSKLSLRAIGVLEDMLVLLLKANKYEALCSKVQSQKVDYISVGHKRAAEARLLLSKLVYEKAKLQLMHVKRDKLQSRVQLLSSAVQKCQMLKLSYTQSQSEPGRQETHVNDSHRQSSLVSSEGEQEGSCNNVSTMRQEIKALDRQIKSLINFFHTYIKLKGEPSCADTISLVNHHLETRTCCRFIHQHLQLWNVDHFEVKNGHYNIHLSYHGYINQRFMGTVGPASNIVLSNKLNDVKIRKNFPNMDAQVAFAFVLNSEATKKSVDSRYLAQETQVTHSLLCSLLDVVEEVDLARSEIYNLIQTSFQTPSAEQLDMQLCFLNCKSGRKVTLTLDMTCLNSGIYPSEILPHQIQPSVSAAEVVLPQPLLAEIRAAAESLESGHMRIMRLCKCISQVVELHTDDNSR